MGKVVLGGKPHKVDKIVLKRRGQEKPKEVPEGTQWFFTIHENEPDLKPITFDIAYIIKKTFLFWNPNHKGKIPILNPNPKKVANYGLPKHEQYFRREVYPAKLERLEKRFAGLTNKIWEELSKNQTEYQEEIAFIQKQIYHLLYGYWFWNNGVMTYIDGWHWLHLNYTTGSYETIDRKTLRKVTTPYPEYRDRDRRKFLIWKFSLVDTQQFANYDEEGYAIPEEDGSYKMVDMGIRLWYGTIYPKHRRDGATTNIITCLYGLAIYLENAYSSIIANRDKTAEEHFTTKLIPAWRRFKFFFKPIHDGTDRPKRALNFVAAASKRIDKISENAMNLVLDSKIDYADVADRIYYDGNKITGGILLDEEGKTWAVNIYRGWDIVKPSMSQGAGSTVNPYALSWHPSTVEEMESGGGHAYKKLTDDSEYYRRNPLTGQTKSGLFYFFLPAYDGLENFVGPYGESIIDDPTPEQAAYIKRNYGAKKYLELKVEELSKTDDPDAKEALESFVRKHPQKWDDCWQIKGGDLGFDQKKLNIAIDKAKKTRDKPLRGNFYWDIAGFGRLSAEEFVKQIKMVRSDIDSMGTVVFVPEPDGKFELSLTISNPSQRVRDHINDSWRPRHPDRFTAAADPAQYYMEGQSKQRADRSKTSFPAGTVFWEVEPADLEKPMEDWESHRFVCVYCHKTNDEDVYTEEMIMMSVYFGALMYPETNIKSVVKWFTERGYAGYLKYDYDEVRGKYKETPGWNTGGGAAGGTKDELFTELKNHIYRHGVREKHLDILMQWKLIKKKEEMTKYDLVACTGGTLRSIKYSPKFTDMNYGKPDKDKTEFKLEDFFGRMM